MSVSVLVGMQWGSEGKGKLAHILAKDYDIHVRTGAPNAGHTIYHNNQKFAMQTIPCGWVNYNAQMIIGAGGMIIPDIFVREMNAIREHDPFIDKRTFIHPNVVIIEPKHVLAEYGQIEPCDHAHSPMQCPIWNDIKRKINNEIIDPCTQCDKLGDNDLWKKIGSTREGCGAALVDKIWRGASVRGPVTLAKDHPVTKDYCRDVTKILNQYIDWGAKVLIEGTQGSGLSLHHGTYPKTTSRDTNVGGWISEAGISPMVITDVFGVFRPYPIRVAGDSGPTESKELTWAEIERRAGVPTGTFKEITTVTKRVRRVFEFSNHWFEYATMINRPTALCLCFADYLNKNDAGVSSADKLSVETKNFVGAIEDKYRVKVKWVSTGPYLDQTVIL